MFVECLFCVGVLLCLLSVGVFRVVVLFVVDMCLFLCLVFVLFGVLLFVLLCLCAFLIEIVVV